MICSELSGKEITSSLCAMLTSIFTNVSTNFGGIPISITKVKKYGQFITGVNLETYELVKMNNLLLIWTSLL